MKKIRYITDILQVTQIPIEQRRRLKKVTKKFAFRANDYYLSLIDWSNEDDPIRRIIIPHEGELIPWGKLDASEEAHYAKTLGLEHKYSDTALLLVNNICGGFCRFCFRKRLFMNEDSEVTHNISPNLQYIRNHPEISNVLLSGGDPLIMSTKKLESFIQRIRCIEHVKIIRIGTKMPAFNPYRITEDPSLTEMLNRYSLPQKRIYIMTNFNHPRELTPISIDAITRLLEAGTIVINQTPLIRGVNNDPDTLAELFRSLSFMGISSYYVFQCRPTLGNRIYAVPVAESYEIFRKARMQVSGLAGTARFIMSHSTGKIEVAGTTPEHIYMQYHRSASPGNASQFMVFKINKDAYWFDDFLKTSMNTKQTISYRWLSRMEKMNSNL
ncbi:MAG: KamA family radical SAM protein [Deltaproteobacteria bacterium]|nr:KamA family radical SAM protein [Deltaproteobacteria bacterium]